MSEEEIIQFIKDTVLRDFVSRKGEFRYSFLIDSIKPFENCKVKIYKKDSLWSDIEVAPLDNPDNYTHLFQSKLQIIADIEFLSETESKRISDYNFNLYIKCYFQQPDGYISFDILDEKKKIFDDYVSMIEKTARIEKIKSFNSDEVTIESQNYLTRLIGVLRKEREHKIELNDILTYDDVARSVQDIQHSLSLLITLKPYLTDFLADPVYVSGTKCYRYFHTMYDKYYLMTANILLEKFYNYWDKIGDILAECFQVFSKTPKKIFFSSVIRNFPAEYKSSKNFQWLFEFHENEYLKLNEQRIGVVHYKNLESTLTDGYHENFGDEEELKKINEQRLELIDYFKNQFTFVFKGFEVVCALIDEIK